jgi:hypothetical protein
LWPDDTALEKKKNSEGKSNPGCGLDARQEAQHRKWNEGMRQRETRLACLAREMNFFAHHALLAWSRKTVATNENNNGQQTRKRPGAMETNYGSGGSARSGNRRTRLCSNSNA